MATAHAQTPSPDRRGGYDGQAMHHFSSSSPSDYLPSTESGLDQTLSPDYLLQQMSPHSILAEANLVNSSEFTTPSFDLDFLDSDMDPTWQVEQQGIRPSDTVKQDESIGAQHRSGVAPANRQEMNDTEIPSLEDQERERRLGEEMVRVRTWLESSRLDPAGSSSEQAWEQTPAQTPGHEMTYDDRPMVLVPNPTEILGVTSAADEDADDDKTSKAKNDSSEAGATPPATVVPSNDEIMIPGGEPFNQNYSLNDKFAGTKPWIDAPEETDSARIKEQPPSSNDAISMFMRKARDIETASLTATLGSRRRSEADLDSLYSATGAIKTPSNPRKRETATSSRPSLFTRMVPRRSNSNTKKRKDESNETQLSYTNSQQARPDSSGSLSTLKRVVSSSRPKSPRLDTNVVNQPSRSPTSPSQLLGSPWSTAKSVVNRVRSRSDAGQNQNPGIAELFARQGGPPTLRVPGSEYDQTSYDQTSLPRDFSDTADDVEGDDDDSPNSAFPVALKIGERPAAPTYEAFKAHVQKLNSRLDFFMVERIAQEQIKRHRRLLEFRTKHEAAVKRGSCPSGSRCNVLGAGPDYTLPTTSGKGGDSTAAIFIVTQPNDSPTKSEASDEKNTSIPATFPDGIPLPPVKQLPAEFECPLCFHVKKFTKPSDWTKHVHEDVQPFTCTFPNCGEPKSFKRKADWVRHESERHRHLESWKCDVPECQHVCYRKDNFVQHLVREHRYPEPRVRLGRATSRGSSTANDDSDIVAHLVEKCRFESSQQPTDEPCRFCGNLCNSWKKLTVHLAKHMEQISMPILELIGHEIPQASSDAIFVGGAARLNALRNQQAIHQMGNSHAATQSMARSQLPSVSVTSTTGSTYPPPNLARGRAVTDSRMGSGAYSPQAAAFMTQSHSPNLSSNGDYSFTYQSSPSFGSNTPQFSPYSFPSTFSHDTQHIPAKGTDLSVNHNMNNTNIGADASTYPTNWSGSSPMQNGSTQLRTHGLWQESHLSASPIEVSMQGLSHASVPTSKSPYGATGHCNQRFAHTPDLKSNVDNMWTFDGIEDPNQTYRGGAIRADSARNGADNTSFPSQGSHYFASRRMMNNQGTYNGWSNSQRFGDFYGSS